MNTPKSLLPFLLTGFLFACGTSPEASKEDTSTPLTEVPDKATLVSVTRLIPTDFTHDLIANGTISAKRKAELRFQVSEPIQNIYVKNGDYVKKGQKLAEVDPTKYNIALAQAEDNLHRALLDLQDILIGQGYTLKNDNHIPDETMRIAETRSSYKQNKINLEIAEINLKNTILYAPFDGVVANLFTKEYNLPNTSEAFCTILDYSTPDVEFNILESELPVLKEKDIVTIYPYAVDDETVEGWIKEINPMVDKNGMVRVKAFVNNTKRLYDGMNVKIVIRQKIDHQLVIPKEALVLRNNRKVVFTAKEGKALWNYVQTGRENSTGYVVTEGLQEGDSVIYDGNVNLAHETAVAVLSEE